MPAETPLRLELEEDRFSRFQLIPWWDQQKIAATKVLVVGAGELGNEILKNLALLGFSQVVVVDLDRVENSNLSRSVLFSEKVIGQKKADAAAASYRKILPGAKITAINGNILSDVGMGIFSWADVIIAGLDNREARLWINRAAWKMNKPWIDGAIEGINGVARVFLPNHPPCYECTLGEIDWQILEKRLSCNMLTRAEMEGGKVPTTPTIASIIAGIQVQEAVKLVHGMPVLESSGYVFEGMGHTSYKVSYTENPDCMSHHCYDEVVSVDVPSSRLTVRDLFQRAATVLGKDNLVLEFSRDIIQKLVCPKCGTETPVYAPLGSVSFEQGHCPLDGEMRTVVPVHSFHGTEDFGGRTLIEMGLPVFDVFSARTATKEIALLISADESAVFQPQAGAAAQ